MTIRPDVFARSTLLLFILLPHGLLALASAADDPPPAMTIRHSVYSDTSAELFWDRLPTPAENQGDLTYRVILDGHPVQDGPAISFFSDNLLPEANHAFDVQAFLDNEELIASGNLLVNTHRPPPLSLPQPGNLHAVVYSPGVFDIFWDREASPLRYEVSLASGTLLGTTMGNSFYVDQTPEIDSSAVSLQIVALDNNGNRSEPSSLLVEASKPSTDDELPTEHTDNLFSIEGGRSLLSQVHQLVFGLPGTVELIERFQQITSGSQSELKDKGFVSTVLYSGGFSTLWSSTTRVDCPDGGSYELFLISTRSGQDEFREYQMNGCQFDGVLHSGAAYTFTNEHSMPENLQGSFKDYTLHFGNGRQVSLNTGWRHPDQDIYAQTINLITHSVPDVYGYWQQALQGHYSVMEANGDTTHAESLMLDWLKPTNGAGCLSLSMRLSAPWTGYHSLQIDTYNEQWEKGELCTDANDPARFSTGYLSIGSTQGHSLTLETNGGSGFNLLITDPAGVTTRQNDIEWSDNACSAPEEGAFTRCENIPPFH